MIVAARKREICFCDMLRLLFRIVYYQIHTNVDVLLFCDRKYTRYSLALYKFNNGELTIAKFNIVRSDIRGENTF